MIIDLHCHYTLSAAPARDIERFSFEPRERDGGAAYDSYISPRAERRISGIFMKRAFGLDADLTRGAEMDRQLADFYARHLEADGAIDRIVLLAFDEYYDDQGQRTPTPRRNSERGSDMYTSNTLVRDLCRRSGGRFLFAASVHPYRPHAVACVEEVFAAGACLLKYIPLHQNIDIADPRSLAVLRKCAELGLPLLLHYGGEFTLTTQHREFQDVSAVLDVLRRLRSEGCMPTTILAHVATPVTYLLGPRHDHELLTEALLGEFADAPLYADISALATLGKIKYLRALAKRQELHGKLLFGSDFPVPPVMLRLRRDLGRRFGEIRAIDSWPERFLRICREMGYNEIVMHRAAEVLPNVHCFDSATARNL